MLIIESVLEEVKKHKQHQQEVWVLLDVKHIFPQRKNTRIPVYF